VIRVEVKSGVLGMKVTCPISGGADECLQRREHRLHICACETDRGLRGDYTDELFDKAAGLRDLNPLRNVTLQDSNDTAFSHGRHSPS
jgi:hypothetical protein